jgi:hypothetical protein
MQKSLLLPSIGDPAAMKIIRSTNLLVLCLLSAACHASPPADAGGASTSPGAAATMSSPSAPASAAITDNPYARTPSQQTVLTGSDKIHSGTEAMPDLAIGSHENEIGYRIFRKYVMANGWAPIVDAKCMENVVGGDYKSQCSSHANGMCGACLAIPELSSCGADGVCLMRFHNASKHLDVDVGTTGDVTDWKGDGNGSSILVMGWTVSPTAAQ